MYVYKPVSFKGILSVTDKSSFRPDNENVRAFKSTMVGDGSVPSYDYPDGKVTKDNEVSDLIVAIRSGKLDKAEVAQIRDAILNQAESDADKAHTEKVIKAMDEVLGINSDNDTDSSN